MRVASQKKAETAIGRYNARFRELTMWRIRATRARSALRHFWVRQEHGKLARALPVLVVVRGKRLAIQNQVIVKSCSLQPRRSGRGGTEYTTKERLLAWRQDVPMGLASQHERNDKDTADRVRRQTSTSIVLYPRPGKRSRRPNPTVAVDVFVRPKDQTMNETRDAMTCWPPGVLQMGRICQECYCNQHLTRCQGPWALTHAWG